MSKKKYIIQGQEVDREFYEYYLENTIGGACIKVANALRGAVNESEREMREEDRKYDIALGITFLCVVALASLFVMVVV